MRLIAAMIAGFLLDLVIGDPQGLLHPVQVIGWFIAKGKNALQRLLYGCSYEEAVQKGLSRKKAGEYGAGLVLAVLIPAGTYAFYRLILYGAGRLHPALAFGLEAVFICQIIAAKSLKTESMKVYDCLKAGDLAGARREISYLVGRDTDSLSEEEIAKADIETIAENTSDGVIAPLFFIALGGAPLGFAYKAVNTLDSMVGYRNEECMYLGFFSAKLDDLFNFIPARLSACMMIAASCILRFSTKDAVRVFLRDRYKHLSPNSAQTEAVAAGALQVCLGGTHSYFGKAVEKPTIGDPVRPVEYEDIRRMNQLMYVSAVLFLVTCCLARWLIFKAGF